MDGKTQKDADASLVRSILEGDRAAYDRMVDKYQARIFRLVFGILDDWQQSEDVCQEVFVNVYLKLSGFGFRSKFSTWIYRVAVNAALKARGRSAKHRRMKSLEDVGADPESEDDRPLALEDTELVSKILRPLPHHLRIVVLLKEKEGLSYKEIAQVLQCSSGAVEQRLHRAFVKLREIWMDRLGELGLEG